VKEGGTREVLCCNPKGSMAFAWILYGGARCVGRNQNLKNQKKVSILLNLPDVGGLGYERSAACFRLFQAGSASPS